METLLKKVRKIEREAQERIDKAENDGQEQLTDLINAKEYVLNDIRVQAQRKAEKINKEQVNNAEAEINKMKQDEVRSVELVHSNAKSNRERAVVKAVDLFKNEYVGK